MEMVVSVEHPALAGHFPANPIVPGVVILDDVFAAAERLGYSIQGVINAKFSAQLLPDERARIDFTEHRSGLAFVVRRDAVDIARGILGCALSGHSH
jgi:3-hydroxymyristoyl/3-hydroxydecanoyl-(acyl carrier protein) dehydratase